MKEDILRQLEEIVGVGQVKEQEPMALHTTFRIGGPADYYVTPMTVEQVVGVRKWCKDQQMPMTLVGNGSNLLVGDGGIRGVVMTLGGLNDIRIEGTEVRAGAGVMLATLAAQTAKAGLSGLQYAGGIPGTLGGGITMNAGAYGGELKDNLTEVLLLTEEGEAVWVPAAEMELGYRTSRIQRTGEPVLAAAFRLQPGEPEQILAEIQEFNARRREKQPLEYPSAGSTFKRPEGYFAGKLIQDAGLAGYRVGDAQVSEKHCGFVINRGRATAAQVLELVRQVQDRVQEQFGVKLEPEIRMIGER